MIRDLFSGGFAFGFAYICFTIALALLSFFSPYDPRVWNVVESDLAPSLSHPLGTTTMGQEVFWFLCFAVRNSLTLGFVTAGIAAIIGYVIGMASGYRGSITDRILMSINDSFLVLPSLPILVLIASVMGARLDMVTMGIILSFFSWPWSGRQVRSMVLSLRERDFTHMAEFSGMSMPKIVFTEYSPFIIPLLMANFINTILWSLGMEVTLSVFGLSSLEIPTIGTMIYWSMQYQAIFRGVWWWVAAPVVFGIVLFVSLFLISTGLSNYMNPRIRMARIRGEHG
jgi:peptide/nickel transport system permease protein